MKNLHYGHCLIGVALAAVVLTAVGASAGSLGFLAIVLACPLMIFVMMRTMMNGTQAGSHDNEQGVSRR